MTVTYHAPCQQQGHGIGKPALDLMALVPGLRVVENDASCCGVAGTYGLKKEKYAISMEVGADAVRADRARPRRTSRCATARPAAGTSRRPRACKSVHPIEILHRASGLPERRVVGLVIVSHSAKLAEGVVELAREMGGEDVAIEAAGGMADPPGAIGTDAMVVHGGDRARRLAATACSC